MSRWSFGRQTLEVHSLEKLHPNFGIIYSHYSAQVTSQGRAYVKDELILTQLGEAIWNRFSTTTFVELPMVRGMGRANVSVEAPAVALFYADSIPI